jgi:hypothetical protein
VKKNPIGYFIDPSTKDVVAILARTKESVDDAKKRVAAAHGIDVAIIGDKIPSEAGNPGPSSIIVDLPDRPADAAGARNRTTRTEVNPHDSVSRFQGRVDEKNSSTSAPMPPIESRLTSESSLLGANPKEPETRSFGSGSK